MKKGIVSFNNTGLNFPFLEFAFRRQNDKIMLAQIKKKMSLEGLKGYDKNDGMKMLMMEADQKTWARVALVITYMEQCGSLKKVSRRAVAN